MKLRITQKELTELTEDQKRSLCDLWIPHIYDAAVATVCIDAEEEKFTQIPFVVGGITLLKHHDMMLYDLKFLPDSEAKVDEEEAYSSNIASDRIDGIENLSELDNNIASELNTEEEINEDFSLDEDFNFEFQRPESYSKQDCLPLLDIGQMIDILERKNFAQCDFYLSASFDEHSVEIGKTASISDYDSDNKNCELCDILWMSIKALL